MPYTKHQFIKIEKDPLHKAEEEVERSIQVLLRTAVNYKRIGLIRLWLGVMIRLGARLWVGVRVEKEK